MEEPKMSCKSTFFITCLIAIFLSVNAQESESARAKNILLTAKQFTEHANYMAEKSASIAFLKGEKAKYHIYRMQALNGKMLERRDLYINGKIATTELSIESGQYMIFLGKAKEFIVKNNMTNPTKNEIIDWNWPFEELARDMKREDASYKLSETLLGNIPCYKVTMKNSLPDNEALAKWAGVTTEKFNSKKEFYARHFPVIKVFTIDKKNLFIYNCVFYGNLGVKVYEGDWGIPDFNAKLNLSMFEPPAGNITVVNNEEDVAALEKSMIKMRSKE
jgi:hypothetical protein